MADPTYPLFPLFSFFSFLLVLAPFPWHFQAWNAGTCTYMFWTALTSLNGFVNSVVWSGNLRNPTPIWCDISSRLMVASSVAIPSSILCIIRRLYTIATMHGAIIDSRAKRRAVYEDLAIGLGIPIVQMALQVVVNGHRYNILEDIGCFPATVNVWLAYPLVTTWPLVISLISTVYCFLTIQAFRRRDTLKDMPSLSSSSLPRSNSPYSLPSSALSSSSSNTPKSWKLTSFTTHRYARLILLCIVTLLLTTPISAFSLALNLTSTRIVPYRGWDDLHWGYSRVDKIPAIIWTGRLGRNGNVAIAVEMSRWLSVVCAVVFFAFFGFTEEARKGYTRTWIRLVNLLRALQGKDAIPLKRHITDLEHGRNIRERHQPRPIQTIIVPSHEVCVTPSTLRSEPRLSSETLVNGGINEKRWGTWSRQERNASRDGDSPNQPSVETTLQMISQLQPLKKVLSSPR